ncbi:Glu-tRNA(Gln) amidotransferase GatDE subunit D [Candidatus Woesearchaeota archaeon CG10_big_fil_rev_8_21_14_0_10_34_12]|nr:MAG: Glu-tRNA(Gln) amidotransferase GatDE subunit D [Candidatus Woesearchaeota archaeon CG10_big_fil_rev_8_21_14_0_10_34_12]
MTKIEKEIDIGSRIKAVSGKKEYEGRLLESYESGILLIKIDSGYNVGLAKEDITTIEILKNPEIKKEKLEKLETKKNLPNIALIATGGTISSKLDPATGGVSWLSSPQQLIELSPKIKEICNIIRIETPFMIASENMSSREWIKLAKLTEKLLNNNDISGVIITHGTDFLHYTSSALSFMLKNLNKPVILTYSQRSTDRGSSDAVLNLVCAAKTATSDIAEVMLVGHASMNDDFCYAIPGTKARKLHSSRRDAFKSVNKEPIAKIWPDKIEILQDYNKRNIMKTEIDAVFNKNVALVKFFPGMKPEDIEYYSSKYDGIIIEVAGLGHLAIDEAENNLLPAIKKAIDNGLIICASPQTIYGRLEPHVYSPGRKLIKTGIIFLEDMLSETALVKLGWLLAHNYSKDEIKKLMTKNFSGEINKRLEE